jgi:hypothetical protein
MNMTSKSATFTLTSSNRKQNRLALAMPIAAGSYCEDTREEFRTEIWDVSNEGLGLRCNKPMKRTEHGDPIQLKIKYQINGEVILANGIVVWQESDDSSKYPYCYGIRLAFDTHFERTHHQLRMERFRKITRDRMNVNQSLQYIH